MKTLVQFVSWGLVLSVMLSCSTQPGDTNELKTNATKNDSTILKEFYVDPKGSDSNSGSKEQPWRTIARAQRGVRRVLQKRKAAVTVFLRNGTYYLPRPVVFTPEDSGTSEFPVIYRAYEAEKPVISGGSRLDLVFTSFRGDTMRATTPKDVLFDTLFVNGKRQRMARYPNYDAAVRPYNGFSADAFSPERAAGWADPRGGYIHAMHKAKWGGYHYRITGKGPDNAVVYEGGWQNNRQMGMHQKYRFVENIFEELDAPSEWFHDSDSNTLYYYPPKGVDLKEARFEVTRLPHLIEFQGSPNEPVTHIELSGITFRHTSRTFMETREPLLRSDWTIYRGGAVFLSGTEDCSITKCEFDGVGGNAVFVNHYNRRVLVKGTHIHGAGASGVCFVGDPGSVRSPLFEYQERQSYQTIDKTPGPKGTHYPADCTLEDMLIHDVGVVEKQAAGVQISMSKGITVRHCSIYDVGRAGINISEGTFGGHLIEYCDVFDTVRETGDHGSFNSWGRDRFWGLKDAPPTELPKLALLDTEKTVIRNSRWRCDHGWDVDLDDGSSNYEIYNNVFLNGGLKLREGFHRVVYNNIAINNSLHAHVWYPDSKDVIRHNIWMTAYPNPIRMPEGKWGTLNDHNLFLTENARLKANEYGWDHRSIAGDPMFTDPARGDYRVKEGSPALKIGFKNFPMNRFGVREPKLKAIARVPKLPSIETAINEARQNDGAPITWLGVSLKELDGEEYSAFGVTKEDGGLQVLKVQHKSPGAKSGLSAGDLIQAVNGFPTPTAKTFLLQVKAISEKRPIKIKMVRGQKTRILEIGGENIMGY